MEDVGPRTGGDGEGELGRPLSPPAPGGMPSESGARAARRDRRRMLRTTWMLPPSRAPATARASSASTATTTWNRLVFTPSAPPPPGTARTSTPVSTYLATPSLAAMTSTRSPLADRAPGRLLGSTGMLMARVPRGAEASTSPAMTSGSPAANGPSDDRCRRGRRQRRRTDEGPGDLGLGVDGDEPGVSGGSKLSPGARSAAATATRTVASFERTMTRFVRKARIPATTMKTVPAETRDHHGRRRPGCFGYAASDAGAHHPSPPKTPVCPHDCSPTALPSAP